jgi:hypothetical protein
MAMPCIRQELATAIQGVSVAVELEATRRADLEKQGDELNRRLGRLTVRPGLSCL